MNKKYLKRKKPKKDEESKKILNKYKHIFIVFLYRKNYLMYARFSFLKRRNNRNEFFFSYGKLTSIAIFVK
jgi:hypothetical protein